MKAQDFPDWAIASVMPANAVYVTVIDLLSCGAPDIDYPNLEPEIHAGQGVVAVHGDAVSIDPRDCHKNALLVRALGVVDAATRTLYVGA